jgi:hypothetical protein
MPSELKCMEEIWREPEGSFDSQWPLLAPRWREPAKGGQQRARTACHEEPKEPSGSLQIPAPTRI